MSVLLRSRDLLAQTGVGPRTLREWIRRGLLPKPIGRGPGVRYTDEHLLRIRVIQHLRSQRIGIPSIRSRLSRLSAADLQTLLPAERTHSGNDAKLGTVPAPNYPARMYEVVELMPGLLLLVDTTRGEVLRRIAQEIYRHFALVP